MNEREHKDVDDEQDRGANADAQSHVVQCPRSPAAALRRPPVPSVVRLPGCDGVDEGSDPQRQTAGAAHHVEDGVAQVVVDRVLQGALGHVDHRLDGHGTWLIWVLLTRVWLTRVLLTRVRLTWVLLTRVRLTRELLTRVLLTRVLLLFISAILRGSSITLDRVSGSGLRVSSLG